MVELDQITTESIFMVGNGLAFAIQWFWLYRTKGIITKGTTAVILFIMLLMVVVILVYYFTRVNLGDRNFNLGFIIYGGVLAGVSAIIVAVGLAYHRLKLTQADANSNPNQTGY